MDDISLNVWIKRICDEMQRVTIQPVSVCYLNARRLLRQMLEHERREAIRNHCPPLLLTETESVAVLHTIINARHLAAPVERGKEYEKMKAALDEANAMVVRYRKQLQSVQDERAASFAMLARTVGGVSLTEYQPEVDIEIANKIRSILAREATQTQALITLRGKFGMQHEVGKIAQQALDASDF